MENLKSDRLSFERISSSHTSGLTTALCDSLVYEFIDMACPTPAELEVFLKGLEAGASSERTDEIWLDYAVRRAADSQLIGRLEATIIASNAEVAYLFGSSFWGQGYAAESLRWLHGFLSEHFGVTHFWASINPANERSMGFIQRLGYAEAPRKIWPRLTSYDPDDRVFCYKLTKQRI